MLYDKLKPEMQQMVDAYAAKLGPMDWQRKSDLLAEAAMAFGGDPESRTSRLAAKGFLTAVIERWNEPVVSNPSQACLYLASLDEGHRAMAERYLEEHPAILEAVELELSGSN
jgi:hypothetical protein